MGGMLVEDDRRRAACGHSTQGVPGVGVDRRHDAIPMPARAGERRAPPDPAGAMGRPM